MRATRAHPRPSSRAARSERFQHLAKKNAGSSFEKRRREHEKIRKRKEKAERKRQRSEAKASGEWEPAPEPPPLDEGALDREEDPREALRRAAGIVDERAGGRGGTMTAEDRSNLDPRDPRSTRPVKPTEDPRPTRAPRPVPGAPRAPRKPDAPKGDGAAE